MQQLLADRQLLQDVNCRDENGLTCLHGAAADGHNRIVLLLLADPRVEVNCRGINGVTPLSAAAHMGHHRVVQTLLADGRVEINCGDDDDIMPLHIAAVQGNTRLVQILLGDQRVNVNCRILESIPLEHHMDNHAQAELATPLHLAAQASHAETSLE